MKKTELSDKNFFCYLSDVFDNNCVSLGDTGVEQRLKTSCALADILLKLENFTVGSLGEWGDGYFKAYNTVNSIKEYLNSNFCNEIYSKEIEKRFSFQYDYVNRLFKRVTGESIIKYKNRQRIEMAKFLLSTTEKDIQTISEEIGFKDPYYFIRYFKKIIGYSPAQFRAKEKNDVL
jgi:AraC-like DNA-binding protein